MSNLNYISLANKTNLIDGVILHPLNLNRDARGVLVESLRSDWQDVFNLKDRGFAMQYYSITKPNTARDNRWHHHKFQEDRFVCAQGSIVVALCDPRPDSKTSGILNLIPMGQNQTDQNQFMLLIPRNVYHIYNVVGKDHALLLNFPTRLYNPDDEGRFDFNKVIIDSLGKPFTWNLLKKDLA